MTGSPPKESSTISLREPMSEAAMIATVITTGGSSGMLDRYFALRNACDPVLWREVITVLAQRHD